MDRAERIGLAVAAVGHAALFALLSATFLASKPPPGPLPATMDVSLAPDVALEAAAPAATEAPAASTAPEVGPPEESPPPAPAAPAPARPSPQPAPAAARPAPIARPQPKPSAAPAKPAPKPAASRGAGREVAASAARPRGGSLGDIMKGIVAEAEPQARGQVPRTAKLDATALAGIQDAIRRQIQPCADRQVDPGPGANEIATTLNLRFNADGTLSATPTVVRQSGADGDAARYRQRVVDLGIAALRACAPLRLPPEFYRTAAGGWSNINFIWKLR